MKNLLRSLVVFVGLLFIPAATLAQDAADEGVLAVIGSSDITADDVSRILVGRPNAFPGLADEERRQRILETLVAEYLIDYFYGQATDQLSPAVLDSLSDARRQVLFQLYAQSRFTPPAITDADVAAFVDENPQLFSERAYYRFIEIELTGGTESERQDALARILQAAQAPDAGVALFNERVSELQQQGLDPSLLTVWASSEALPAATLERLLVLASEGRDIDVQETDTSVRILLLLDVDPVPVTPDELREQIELRILQQAFTDYRETLVRRMAATVLADVPAPDDTGLAPLEVDPPDAGTVVWAPEPTVPPSYRLAAFSASWFFGVIGLYAALSWVALVRRQYPELRSELTFVPSLRRPVPAGFLGGLLALCLVGVLAGITWLGDLVLGLRAIGVFMIGAIVIGCGVCWAWRDQSRRRFLEREAKLLATSSDARRARRRAVLQDAPYPRLLLAVLLLFASVLGAVVLIGDVISIG
ncbi:hypothetical protein HKCCSP123_17345 [Rhodobacterales bacterium HKCCSP123]|nr:hypothetical protein [Rhodobacterales bacterium HKCCSP123]